MISCIGNLSQSASLRTFANTYQPIALFFSRTFATNKSSLSSNAFLPKRPYSLDLSLMLVTNRICVIHEEDFIHRVKRAVEGGVTCVQIRDTMEDTRKTISTARKLLPFLRALRVPLIINDRVDIALAVGADGVHIGQNDFPYAEARKVLGPDAIIGLSVDCWKHVEIAQRLDVTYLGVSQIFPSPRTKPNAENPTWGLKGLKKVREYSKHRLVAIGGINQFNLALVSKCLEVGDGIALVGDLWRAKDPFFEAQKIRTIFQSLSHV